MPLFRHNRGVIGKRLGEYTILARIGQGGMGVVYVAEGGGHQRVALKVLGDRMEPGPGLKRFARELETLQRVSHPRIVAPKSALLEDEGVHFFAMELVAGRNLAEVLVEVGRLEPSDALRIVSDALDGLTSAHAEGVLHRDLKCANLLLDAEGEVKVCDFGLARAIDQTRQTMSGTLLGTPAFAAPEQARGLDSRVESDVYSMGVVLYEALTGTLPFRAESPVALLRLHLEAEPDPPSARRPGIPPELDALILRCLAKDPGARYPSADALKSAVDDVRSLLVERELSEARPLARAVVDAVQGATRALDERVQAGRLRRSGNVGAWFAGALVLAGFAFGILRLSEPRFDRERGVAAITSQDFSAREAEVDFADGARHRGRLRELPQGRLRLVCAEELILEFPRHLAVRIRYLEAAPVDSPSPSSSPAASPAQSAPVDSAGAPLDSPSGAPSGE